jgi:hypothetical protein
VDAPRTYSPPLRTGELSEGLAEALPAPTTNATPAAAGSISSIRERRLGIFILVTDMAVVLLSVCLNAAPCHPAIVRTERAAGRQGDYAVAGRLAAPWRAPRLPIRTVGVGLTR